MKTVDIPYGFLFDDEKCECDHTPEELDIYYALEDSGGGIYTRDAEVLHEKIPECNALCVDDIMWEVIG